MEFKIKQILDRISSEKNIKIICATECGSRAYGLNSDQSDYDIRFVYIHAKQELYKNDYLDVAARKKRLNDGLQDCPDVEPKTYTGTETVNSYNGKPVVVDWHGWDVTKAVKHLHEMNPSIVEWMFSPIVYIDLPNYRFIERAKALLSNHHRSGPLIIHYKSMGRTHFIDHVKSETNTQVILKKYLVCVRCSLMVLWLKLNRKYNWRPLIEVNFVKVLDKIKPHLDSRIYSEVINLIEKKKKGQKIVSREKVLDDLIESILDMDIELNEGPYGKP